MGLGSTAWVLAARYHRRFRTNARWVAITGSTGKTTTAMLVSAVLERRGRVVDGTVVSTANSTRQICRTIFKANREHRYGVVEVSVGGLGDMVQRVSAVRPDIGIVTTIGSDHRKIFKTLEATAREKSEVVRQLREDGVAILNADDPLVWTMRDLAPGRVIGCGRSPEATLRVEKVRAAWPERLTLDVRYGSQPLELPTRFVGNYATFPVLAALAAGIAEEIPLPEAAEAIAAVEPIDGRMCPHETPDGITFIDNGWKTPHHLIRSSLDFLREASADRKIVVFGEISDYSNNTGRLYRSVARAALEVADIVAFSGKWAYSALKVARPDGRRLVAYDSTAGTNEGLKQLLQPGDLVLLQGSQRLDHFERIVLDRMQAVRCWTDKCGLVLRCRQCERLTAPLPSG